jgi:hypothetical protein
MPRPPIEVSADQRDFAEFLGKTSTLDKKLKTSLRKKVREAGQEAAKASQAEVLKPPLHKGKGVRIEGKAQSRGLRSKISQGIAATIATSSPDTAGVTVKATAKALPADQKRLLRKYNSERGWRHPSISTARRLGRLKGALGRLGVATTGKGSAAANGMQVLRNTGKWHQQKGRPYFGKVLAARQPQLAQAVTEAVTEARKAAGLP